jgi:hypothetical protein
MMDPRRALELGELLLDGELSPSEAAELRTHMEGDPTAVAALHTAIQEHVQCRTALRSTDAAVLAERTRRMLESWRPASGEVVAKRVIARIRLRRSHVSFRWWSGLVAAVLVLGVGLSFLLWQEGTASPVVADGEAPHVTELSGLVWQSGGKPLTVGHTLEVREAIAVGTDATATLAWSDGTTVRIAGGSRVVRLAGTGQRLQLEHGTVMVTAAHRPTSEPLEIISEDATTRVVGTAFVITVKDGRSQLTVSDGVVRLTRTSDGIASLVGAGQQIATAALPLPTTFLMEPQQLAAVRAAIAAEREPWASSWAALRKREAKWLTPPTNLPAIVAIPSYNGGNPVHSAARLTIADATQPALGLALIARLGNDERAAAAAVQRILAWLPVRVEGPEADIVLSDATIALVQAADLLRGTPVWTARKDLALGQWIESQLAPAAASLLKSRTPEARWRGVAAAMTIAAWRGDQANVRALMARLRTEIADEFAPEKLALLLPGTGEKRGLLQDLVVALQCSDIARIAAGDDTPPPPEWATTVSAFLTSYAQVQPIDGEKTFFMRALVGPGPWRTSAAQPYVVGPDPARGVSFGWYFPTLTARDPRW